MNRRNLLKSVLATGVTVGTGLSFNLNAAEKVSSQKLPKARYDRLPQWRGFNLLEKFNGHNERFREDDFRWIRDFGFNFVRLPMDYRAWIVDKDWRKFDEKTLGEIDEAIKLGEKYGIHVNINFHRAPGYTVAKPAEPKSVWTDPEALEVCILHWKTFAKRYKGISNDLVSFNLFNEPDRVEDILDQCVAAHKAIIKGIREEDPDRLIICDGYEWGNKPFFDLADQKIAQATRGYAPGELSHYKASWAGGENFPMPTWPIVTGNGTLFSPVQSGVDDELKGYPMTVAGPFKEETKLRIHIGNVSGNTSLAVKADGNTIFKHDFKPGPGEGEWEKVVYTEQWKTYQNIYNRDYTATIPSGTKKVEILVNDGQWFNVTEIGVLGKSAKEEASVKFTAGWGQKPSAFEYRRTGDKAELIGGNVKDRAWLLERLEPWKELQKQGCGVIVGEFGAFSPTPHDVTLRWMADMLANWKEAGWGYALWNFRGSFGIMDSGRQDVDYEDFHGHKLDRKMLTLLQK